MRVDFSIVPVQSRTYRLVKPGNRLCNAWGRGIGKTWFARVVMFLLIALWDGKERETADGTIRGIRIILLYPTIAQFKRIKMAQALLDELSPAGRWGFLGADINRTTWEIRFPGGSWIQVVSAENIDDNRGLRTDVLIADECDDIDETDYVGVCVPWFSQPWSLNIRMLSGTPRRGRFGLLWKAYRVWPHGDAESPALANHYSTHATYKDAPRVVSAETVEEARRLSPSIFSREWECNFDSGEGLVYPFFSVEFHVRRAPALHIFFEYIVGFDYGFNDPSVFAVIGIAGTGRDAICHVLKEVYVTGKSDTELAAIAASIEESYPGAKWYSDHHPSTIAQFKNDAHVNVREADKGPKSVENGVAFVADALFVREDEQGRRWSQLYVDPTCKHTIDEFGLYRRKRDPRNKDRVLDDIDTSQNDHCMDALRYALVTHFGRESRRLIVRS